MAKSNATKPRRKARINEEVLRLELVGVRAAVSVAASALAVGPNLAMATVLHRMAINPLDHVLAELEVLS